MKNIHIPKENLIMAREKKLKARYEAKRGDMRHLAAAAKPGTVLYVIHGIGDRYVTGRGAYGHEDPELYSVWVVLNEMSWPSTYLMVARAGNTSGRGDQSLSQLLHHEREIHTVQPMYVRCMDDQRSVAQAHELAARVAKQHAEEVALANAEKTLAGVSGGKKGWF